MEGEGKKNSIDVNEQTRHLRDFYHEEEIAGLIVLGRVCGARRVCKPCEYWRWWGYESAFQTGSCKSTFNHLVWAWLQTGGGVRGLGCYIRRVWGQDPFQLTGLLRLQHTCGLKIDSPLLCISSLAYLISHYFSDLSGLLSWATYFLDQFVFLIIFSGGWLVGFEHGLNLCFTPTRQQLQKWAETIV